MRTRGGNLSASVFRPSLSALASRSLGGRRYHPPGAISFLHSRRGALVERIAPQLNPFDALYNWSLARSSGITLASAPAPRRFAQFLAGSFAIAIGLSLVLGWRMAALVLEGFFIVAIGALLFGGFCFGSFVFHLLCGRADFAKRTLPWATGV